MSLNPADAAFVETLAAQLPEGGLHRAEGRYLEEPRGRWNGISEWVAMPRTTEEVSRVIRSCSEARVGVIPYGGGTGLVGGQVTEHGPAPLLLSLERMSAIRQVVPEEYVAVVEAGAILADVRTAARAQSRLFPLSLASEGSARIGGLLSTNAGGVNVLRYGNARELVLGLEAVLPDGTIWNGLKRLRKDNTGYDLKHLFMGAEGTLGVITAAVLKLSPIPASTGTAVMVVDGPGAALSLLAMARDALGDGVSAFELISGMGLRFLRTTLPDIRQPFEQPPEWMVLIDLGLPRGLAPHDALESLFAEALDAGLVSDGVIAQSESHAQAFWSVREHIPEANRRIGAIASHDISLPLGAIREFTERGPDVLKAIADLRINCFGHLGDGNLHYNVFPPEGRSKKDYANQADAIQHAVHELVQDMGGSVSAEHGIGRLKTDDLERYSDPAKLAAMRAIKNALDPQGIMNPGAVLRTGV